MIHRDQTARSRIARLGPIHRAREYRLYDRKGRRYLDLWQSGGRALLGHRPKRTLALVKGVLSQGSNAGLPSVYEDRLLDCLRRLIPGFEPFLTNSDAEVCSVLSRLGFQAEELYDPALSAERPEASSIGLWRPIAGPSLVPLSWSAIVPILPLTIGQAPSPICVRLSNNLAVGMTNLQTAAPQPAALLAAAVAGLEQLTYYRGADWADEAWPDPSAYAGWERRGPYVAARCESCSYDAVFDRFLQAGVLLSPIYPGPSILPSFVSAGEQAILMRLFAGKDDL